MAIVTFMPMNYVVKVEDGITVLKAEHLAGITQKAQCGGHGKCGKCKVWICVRHSRERWFLEIKDAIEAGAGSQMTACDEKEFLKTDELLKK